MSNYYTICSAEQTVPCTEEKHAELAALLEAGLDYPWCPGFELSYSPGGVYLSTSEESSNPEALPPEFLQAFGAVIAAAGLPYLEVGVAETCSRNRPGSHGGTAFRIHPDGALTWPLFSWPPSDRTATVAAFVVTQCATDDDWEHPIHTKAAWENQVGESDETRTYRDWLCARLEAGE